MINADLIQPNGEKIKNTRNPLMSFLALWKKQFNEMLENLANKKTFNVEVKNNNEAVALSKQIVHQLEVLNQYQKKASKSKKPLQNISIKTTDLITLNKKIEDLLVDIKKKDLIVKLPKVQKMIGRVKVENFPKEYPFDKLADQLREIKNTIKDLKLEVPPFPEIKQPDVVIPEFPTALEMKEAKDIIKELKNVQKELQKLPKTQQEIDFPDSIKVSNFPPQKIPQPVTNININPLRGWTKTRSVTVGTTRVPLPGEILSNRRSLLVFNNDSSETLYIGGANVVAGDGLPVLAQTYSPVIDAGTRLVVYGIVSSGSIDVRTMEVSNENLAGG